MAIPSDYTIVGTVLAIAVAILLLSGLALYIAFRVRETLHDERGRTARLVKVSLLIGLLFLSGGVFFFFASGFGSSGSPGPTQNTTLGTVSTSSGVSSLGSTSLTSATSTGQVSTSTNTASSSTSTTVTTVTTVGGGSVTMQVSYPSSVTAGQGFYLNFYIYNGASTTLSGASLDVGNLGITFAIVNATICNPQCTSATWSGSAINIGSLGPGATTVTLGVKAPSSPTQFSGQASLDYQGETQPVSATITIRVTGRP